MDERLTYVSWLVVDEHGNEVEDADEDALLRSGGVMNVPGLGDTVFVGGRDWVVAHRLWSIPIGDDRAMTPRQAVTLHIREVNR